MENLPADLEFEYGEVDMQIKSTAKVKNKELKLAAYIEKGINREILIKR